MSNTACPRAMPRCSNFVSGRHAGRGANPSLVLASSGSAAQHGEDFVSVRRPIGCDVQVAPRREAHCEVVHECGLQQAALVVALLRPWIRKIDVDASQRVRRDHRDNVHRIGPDDANVGELRFIDPAQQRAYAGQVHLRRPGSRRAAAPPRSPRWSRPCRIRFPARPERIGRKCARHSSGVPAGTP